MSKKNGFTLVELLVVITIIGIITVLALPGVQKIQNRNRNKKYEAYADTIIAASKLYTDAYADDLFGMQGSGCAIITYDDLKGKSLIKDYEVDGISCNDPRTFVKVERNGDKYKYSVSLKCKNGDREVYETTPEIEKCFGGVNSNKEIPSINVTWKNLDPDESTPNQGWSREKDVTINISAPSGLIDNISIRYGWTTDPNNPPSEDVMHTYNYRNAYGTLEDTFTFHDLGKDENGNYRNGIWYLYVIGEDVIDVGGHVADNYRSGVMKFDNTLPVKPDLVNGRNNYWTGEVFVSANKYVIGVRSNDEHSGVGFYQYCYPEDNGCNEYSDWITYENSAGNNFTTTPFTEQRDEDVYIRACDRANNCSEYSSNRIKIDTEYPTCNITRNGTYGINDWYVTNVNLSMSISNPGVSYAKSPIKYGLVNRNLESYNSVLNITQKDVKNVTWYGFITDEAGNATTCNSGKFKVDTTKPTCKIIADSSKVYFSSKTDSTSGIDKSGINKSSTPNYSSDTQSLALGSFYGHVTDMAGNVGVCTTKITKTVSYDYACGSHACGTYKCNCGYTGTLNDKYSCDRCTKYCTTYCSGKKCSSGNYKKINSSYCYS